MLSTIKKLAVFLVLCTSILLSQGCSYAHIKNRVGRDDGMTYERIETVQPKSQKTITIRKVNGRYIIVKEEGKK